MKKLLAMLLVAVLMFGLVACDTDARASVSLTMDIATGDKIEVELDKANGHSMNWDRNENELIVSKDGKTVLSLCFTDYDHLSEQVELASEAPNVDVVSNGSGNGTKRSIIFVESDDDDFDSAHRVVAWVVGSNTGVIAMGTDSHEETKEAFEALKFTVESTDQKDDYFFLETIIMSKTDADKQPVEDDNETEAPVEEETEAPSEEATEAVEETEAPAETEPKDEPAVEPVNDTISDDWMDLDIMIDGVVYHYPYDYDKLLENGWTLNMADYGYEDGYAMNKGEKTSTTISLHHEKYDSESRPFVIDCGFANYGEETVDIKECDLWSIKINCIKYSSPYEEHSSVQIAKGIKFGSTAEEVIAAFGDGDEEPYRAEELGYTVYSYRNNFAERMKIVVYDDFGVTEIQLQKY